MNILPLYMKPCSKIEDHTNFKDRHGGLVVRELPPCEREVVGSIPSRDRPKSLKLVVVAFPLGFRIMGIVL